MRNTSILHMEIPRAKSMVVDGAEIMVNFAPRTDCASFENIGKILINNANKCDNKAKIQ